MRQYLYYTKELDIVKYILVPGNTRWLVYTVNVVAQCLYWAVGCIDFFYRLSYLCVNTYFSSLVFIILSNMMLMA